MTDSELDRLERLAQAATPGPWTGACLGRINGGPIPPGSGWRADTGEVCVLPNGRRQPGDLAFIMASREAVPALVREIRRLRGEPAPVVAVLPRLEDLPDGTIVEMRVGTKRGKNLRWVPARVRRGAYETVFNGQVTTFTVRAMDDSARPATRTVCVGMANPLVRIPLPPSPLARQQANVFADFLEDHGFSEAASKLREAFPLIDQQK